MEWASDYADRIDPLKQALGMPADPNPTPEALKPFMGSFDASGPW